MTLEADIRRQWSNAKRNKTHSNQNSKKTEHATTAARREFEGEASKEEEGN